MREAYNGSRMGNAAQELLTTAEAAELLGKSVATVNRMAAAGKLRAVIKYPGPKGARLFRRLDIERQAVGR